jgi:two-component system, response regulator PdtaR
MTILIVADEVFVALTLQVALERAGHQVVGPAFSAGEALQLAEAEPPDIALVDIDLRSEIDGIEVARLLRDRHGTTSLFLTGQLEAARSAGDIAADIILKPYDLGTVVCAIDAVARIRLGSPAMRPPPQLEGFG